ncbi:MAG: hybrid sensor histidine kinase/response regulator [Desulfamplus sp.]|nr:hybrid sensor histidine kinase/response regulator [Desulfamplus sp.]
MDSNIDSNVATKILVIDDEVYIRTGIKNFLEDYNFKVLDAENGRQGLECFERESPDIVFCDLIMPELGGLEVLDHIVKISPDTPIIIVSGVNDLSNTMIALKAGAWDYIIKPVQDMTVLLHAIEKSLEKVALIREKDMYKKRLLNEAVDAGRTQLSAMILHNIGNAITPVSVYAANLKKKNPVQNYRYLAQCYSDLMEHKDNLTEYISKDPRGSAVIKYMGTLIENLESDNNHSTEIIDKIASGVDYVAHIVTIQRDYAPDKIEVKERININLIVEDALQMQKGSISKLNITIKKNLLNPIPQIIMEKNKLMQVLVNLIKNSCDAIDENKERTEHQLDITTYCNQQRIGLEIRDTGIGVDIELQKSIFDFGTSSKGSSGFGLYYCKSFLEANKATLTLESQGRGLGSTVTMEIPFVPVRQNTSLSGE